MTFRFCSGSVTPRARRGTARRRRRTRPAAGTSRRARRRTCAASSSRSTPLSTNTQVSRSPMARCMSSAATVESTPPLSAADHAPAAHLRPDARHRLVDVGADVPVAPAAADPEGEAPEHLGPCGGVRDLRVEQQRRRAAARRPPWPPPGALALVADDPEARRRRATRSPWLAQTSSDAGNPSNSRSARLGRRHHRGPVLPVRSVPRPARPADRSSSACRSRCRAPARRTRARPGRTAARRRPARSAGPPDRMMPAGARARTRLGRLVPRHHLRVDRELPEPARDELRVLRTEVEDENGLVRHGANLGRTGMLCRIIPVWFRGRTGHLPIARPASPRARGDARREGAASRWPSPCFPARWRRPVPRSSRSPAA